MGIYISIQSEGFIIRIMCVVYSEMAIIALAMRALHTEWLSCVCVLLVSVDDKIVASYMVLQGHAPLLYS